MGKLGPRLASRKKAKRWAKGQSSSSNPTTTKNRERAACMFFKDLPGSKPGITKDDLQKHDAIQGIEPQIAKFSINEDQAESTLDGVTINTSDTFASSYSNCSNISFNRFLSHFQSSSILHKEMLAMLSAVTEIIQQKGGSETSTEYFAALMSTLEVVEDDTSVAATMSLLGMILKTVPKNVLNLKFGATSKALLQILIKYAFNENSLIVRHCISCVSVLLRAQETAVWADSSTMAVLDAVLTFVTHEKPKVRKSAQHGICAILKGSDIMKSEKPPMHHPAAAYIATHCIAQLKTIDEPRGLTTILHTLTLLKDVTHLFPKSQIKTICESMLQIMTLQNVLITSCCLQTLHGLFISRPSEATLPSEMNGQIINALYDYQPPMSDTQPTLAWLAVMQEAHCNLACINLSLCSLLLPRMVEKCVELLLSDKTGVISGTSNTIKTILQECVAPFCKNNQRAQECQYHTTLRQIVSLLHKSLNYQYLEAWGNVFHLIAVLFQVTGRLKLQELVDIVRTLGELRDSYNYEYSSDTEYAIGAAIKAMGAEVVLEVLPLQVRGDTINLKRGWLIPLLKDCITHGTISFFTGVLLPIAQACEQKATKELMNGRTYEFLVPQIWSILPSICNDASDVKDNFKSIAQKLGKTISERKELRLPVLSALRKLIVRATQMQNEADTAELTRFAKNYLPILFNVYTTRSCGTDEEGQRLAAFDTIKIYLTITSKELANELFDRAFANLNQPGADNFLKESIYDLIRLLIGYTDIEKLKKFFDMCLPFFSDNTKKKEQKKAYRFLEEVCGSDKEVCKNFLQEHRHKLQKIFTSSATSVVQTSKGPRLKCLTHLVKLQPLPETDFLDAILPEAVLCVKDINERCRNSAYQLIHAITEKYLLSNLGSSEQMQEYVNKLMVGIAGDDKYCSATLLVLATLIYHYNSSLGTATVNEILNTATIREILSHVCTILTNGSRTIVESALSYVKVYLGVMPSTIVAPTLPQVIGALSQMKEDCKRHFRQKVRDIFIKLIRKYGIGPISDMVPASDVILHKRLKNINKVEDAKRKNREIKRAKQLESDDTEFNAKRRPKSIEEILADSDEEFETTEKEEPKRSKKRTSRKEAWIQENEENIVDLIDPAAARNITS